MRQIPRMLGALAAVACASAALYLLQHDLVQLHAEGLPRVWKVALIAAALSIGNYALRIVRWRAYLRAFGRRLPLAFAALTYTAGFAYTLSPGKVGEMVRARYYERIGIPLSDVAAAFFAERLLDLVAMVVLATLLIGGFGAYAGAMRGALGLVAILLAALALVPWGTLAARLSCPSVGAARVRRLLGLGLASLGAARKLFDPRLVLVGFTLGLGAWALEGLGLGVIASAFPATHLSTATALGIYGIAVLIGGLTFLPGGLGSAEAVMAALLVARGFPAVQAVLITLICRLVTLWLAVSLGWGAVLALRQRAGSLVALWP